MRRDRLQREFLNALAAVGLVAVLLLVGAWRVYESAIDTQKARVAVIASEIEGLDARIAEIRVLQKKRKELLDRMRVIQELQGQGSRSRSEVEDRTGGCSGGHPRRQQFMTGGEDLLRHLVIPAREGLGSGGQEEAAQAHWSRPFRSPRPCRTG